MAKKISQLPVGSTPVGSEKIEAVQAGISVQLTFQQIANLAPGAVSGALALKGLYAMGTTNNYPIGANAGYLYVTSTDSTRQRNGNPIPAGSILLCLVDSASTTSDSDWSVWYTF